MSAPLSNVLPPEFSPLSLARMLWKRKLLVLVTWIVVSVAAYFYVAQIPAMYYAEANVLIDSQKVPYNYVAPTVTTDLQDRLATLNQQILSSTRLKKIMTDLDLYREERKTHSEEQLLMMMRTNIAITVAHGWRDNRPGAFKVAFHGGDPQAVAQVANRLAHLYIEENLKNREIQSEGTAEFVEAQLQEAKKRLDEFETTVSQYKMQHKDELPQQENALVGKLGRLGIELQGNGDAISRAQQSKLMLQNTLNMAEATLASMVRAAETNTPAPVAAQPPVAAPAQPQPVPPVPPKQSEIQEAQLEQLRLRYSDDHPDIKRLRATIRGLKQIEEREELERLVAFSVPTRTLLPPTPKIPGVPEPAEKAKRTVISMREAVELGQARERVSNLTSQMDLLEKEIQEKQAATQRIQAEIAVQQAKLEKLPVREQEMTRMLRDYGIWQNSYRTLLDKKLAAEMATDLERRQKAERFTIIDPARIPDRPFRPNRKLLTQLGSLAGLVLGLVLALAKEIPNGVLLGEWELPPNTPILGRLPHIQPSLATVTSQGGGGLRTKISGARARIAILSSVVFSVLLLAAGALLGWRGL